MGLVDTVSNWSTTKKVAVGLSLLFTTVAGISSLRIIPSQKFAVHVRAGQLISDDVQPGFYFQWPILDNYYDFSNNTIIMETTVGGTQNTQDQNSFSADMRLHYRIDPHVGLMALKVKEMSDDNGKELLTELMNQSLNAVVGSIPATATVGDPTAFMKAFGDNLKWRIAQNNVPIRVDAVELLNMQLSANIPTQMKMKPVNDKEWTVENMAGPAAVPVARAAYKDADKVADSSVISKATSVPVKPKDTLAFKK